MKNIIYSKKIVKYYAVLFILTSIFALYYYGIQQTITPDHEELSALKNTYYSFQFGEKLDVWHAINAFVLYFLIPFVGYSYETIRVTYTIFYACYVLFSLDIILRKGNWKIHWGRLLLYMMFMVFVPIKITEHWGQLGTGWIQYPLNQHTECMLCLVIGLWLLWQISNASSETVKKALVLMLILWNVFSIRMTDQIWLVSFFLPELLCGIRYIIIKYKIKNVVTIVCVLACMGIFGLKILSIRFGLLETFFQYAGQGSAFFKSADWSSLSAFPGHFSNYVTAITALFGCDISQLNIYNIVVFFYAIKLILVGFIFFYVIVTVCNYKDASNIELCISLGIVFLSLFWIFTDYADMISHHIRYLILILPYGTIMLCLHSEDIANKLHIVTRKNRIGIGIALSAMLIALFPYGIWGREKEDKFDQEYREVVETIEEKELHTGIWTQSYGLGTYVNVLSGGKYSMSRATLSDDYSRIIMTAKPDTLYDYIVFEKNGNDGFNFWLTELDYVFAYANGQPDEIVELCDGEVVVYIYRNGVPVYSE